MRRAALISLIAAWQCSALAPANRPLAAPGKHVHAQRAPARALPPQAEPAPDLEAAVPDGLPATPSFKLVAFLWANTLLLAPVALAGAAMGANVLGPNWAWSAKAARQGVLFALPWIALSFAPLDKWVPAMADVTAHTELLTATALGVEFGGYRRWGQVAGATALVSASAGALEEAAFRGVAQRGVAAARGPAAGESPRLHRARLQLARVLAESDGSTAPDDMVPALARAVAAKALPPIDRIGVLSDHAALAASCRRTHIHCASAAAISDRAVRAARHRPTRRARLGRGGMRAAPAARAHAAARPAEGQRDLTPVCS